MDYLAGEDVSFTIPFTVRGQPAIPTAGTVRYTLYDADGTKLVDNEQITTTGASFTATISIPAEFNEITADFEKRTLIYNYAVSGSTFQQRLTYRLIPFLNFTVTPAQVRSFIGVNQNELPDEDIDLVRSYFKMKETLSDLDTALAAGGLTEIHANEAILYNEVLELLPSVRLRAAGSETNGPLGFSRFRDTPDFDKIEAAARDKLSEVIGLLSLDGEVTPVLAIVDATRTDTITGA